MTLLLFTSRPPSMPLDLWRSTPQHKVASRDAKGSLRLLALAATTLLVCLVIPLSGHSFLSTIPQICAAVRCYLVRRYIFIAVNCMLLVILKLAGRERHKESIPEGSATGEVSLEVWFDCAPSPTFRDVRRNDSDQTLASTLQPADSSPGGSASDEPSPTSGYESPASFPVPAAAVGGINTSEKARAPPPVEEEDDSLDATWKAIIGRAAATAPHLKKSNTWDTPPRPQVEPAVKGQLIKKSETFQEAAALAAARRAVLERRMQGREVAVVEDHDEMNRRFEGFIKKFNDQLRLQRLASLRRRRYMDMLYSA